MKATGIVRRIDDLGRVVIPKEIRRTMRIREGDPLEIYTDREGEVIFKKYSPIGELTTFASQYADTLYKTCNLEVLICDRDAVIAVAGVSKKEYMDKPLSSELDEIMQGIIDVKYDGYFNFEASYTLLHSRNIPYNRRPFEHNGETVRTLLNPTIELKKKAVDLLYEIGAHILKTYDCYEE